MKTTGILAVVSVVAVAAVLIVGSSRIESIVPHQALASTNSGLALTQARQLARLAMQVARAPQPGVKRTDLQRHDLSVPGHEAVQVRVEIGPGVTFPKHTHPGDEIIHVLEGALEYEVEGKAPVTLKAGEVLFIPDGTIHAASNLGSGNAAELATYVIEKGKPLLTLVK